MTTENKLWRCDRDGNFAQYGGIVPVPAGKTPTGMMYVSETQFIGIFQDDIRTMTLSGGEWTAAAEPDTRFGTADPVYIAGRCVWAGSKFSVLQSAQTATLERTVQYVDPNPPAPTPTPTPTPVPTATPTSVPTEAPSPSSTVTATVAPKRAKAPLLSDTLAAVVIALLCAAVVTIIVMASVMRPVPRGS
jgi:hypothetical protein